MQALKNIPLSLLLITCVHADAAAQERFIQFAGLSYPLEIKLPAGQKAGGLLYETPYSEPSAENYEIALVQGEMPDPDVRLEVALKPLSSSAPAAIYAPEAFRLFPGGRFWARFRVPRSAQPLKLRVINLEECAPSYLRIYEAELLRASEIREAVLPSSTAPYVPDAALFLPDPAPFKLVRRAAWHALPATEPYTQHTPAYFTLHHTQAHYPETYERAVSEMQFIQDFHQNGRGWIDIGYHFLIDPAGNIFEGRPIGAVGAHVKNRNTGNIGISIMGSYHPPSRDVFTDLSRDAFVAIGRYLKDTYEVPVSSFYAHREIGKTDCPGDNLYALKPLLSGLIFEPQAQNLPASAGDTAPLTPAQRRSLRQLILYLNRN